MEFQIKTDLEKALPAVIDFNFEEMKTELAEKLAYYNSLVVTEDAISSGKADRAKLNKLVTAIEDRRKEVKKQCLAPYEGFEMKCKELTGMIGNAITTIDTQVKAFEDVEKDGKRKALENFYKVNIKGLIDLLPLKKIWSDKWLNKGVTLPAASKEMIDIITRVHNDVEILRAMRLECETVVIDTYLRTLDMSVALAEKKRFEEQQEKLQALAAQQEAEKPRAIVIDGENGLDNIKLGDMVSFCTDAVCPAVQNTVEQTTANAPVELKTIKVVFYDTTPEFRAEMKALTQKHNIRYGGIQ